LIPLSDGNDFAMTESLGKDATVGRIIRLATLEASASIVM